MSEFSRRGVLGGVAAGALLTAAAASEAKAQGLQPPSGPTPAPLAGAELPPFRFALGATAPNARKKSSTRPTLSTTPAP